MPYSPEFCLATKSETLPQSWLWGCLNLGKENLPYSRGQKLESVIFTVHVITPTLKPDCVSEIDQRIYGEASLFLKESFIISSIDAKGT